MLDEQTIRVFSPSQFSDLMLNRKCLFGLCGFLGQFRPKGLQVEPFRALQVVEDPGFREIGFQGGQVMAPIEAIFNYSCDIPCRRHGIRSPEYLSKRGQDAAMCAVFYDWGAGDADMCNHATGMNDAVQMYFARFSEKGGI